MRKRGFRFENSWLSEPDCREVVNESWSFCGNYTIHDRIENCSGALQKWGEKLRLHFKEQIKECRRQLKFLKAKRDAASLTQFAETSKNLGNLFQ